jgi:hypothetical protein
MHADPRKSNPHGTERAVNSDLEPGIESLSGGEAGVQWAQCSWQLEASH